MACIAMEEYSQVSRAHPAYDMGSEQEEGIHGRVGRCSSGRSGGPCKPQRKIHVAKQQARMSQARIPCAIPAL